MFSHLMTNVGDVEPSILTISKYSDGRQHELAKAVELGARAYFWEELFAYPFAVGDTFVDFKIGYVVEIVGIEPGWLYMRVGYQTRLAPIETFVRAIHDGRIVEL
jgi:hypothetical protein